MTVELEQDLRDAMVAATSTMVARPDLTTSVRTRFRRHRRNRRLAATAFVVVAAIAVPGSLLLTPTDSGMTQLTPARPTPTSGSTNTPSPTPSPESSLGPGRTVGGVDITWLPAGLALDQSVVQGSQTTRGALAYRSSFRHETRTSGSFLDVDVQWGPTPSLDAVQATMAVDQSMRTFARTTVRGHQALFTQVTGKGESAFVWVQRPGLLLSVGWGPPVTENDARRVADGLVVRAQPPIADPVAAAAIRAAFGQAFTAGVPARRALAAVENGLVLTSVRARFLAAHPGLARTLRVTVRAVIERDASHATAGFTLTYADPTVPTSPLEPPAANGRQTFTTSGQAVRTAVGWQVSRTTYCQIISLVPTARC